MSATDSTDRASLRIPPDQLAEIDRLWHKHGFPNRTEYMIAAALSYVPEAGARLDDRLVAIEGRLDRLEESEFRS